MRAAGEGCGRHRDRVDSDLRPARGGGRPGRAELRAGRVQSAGQLQSVGLPTMRRTHSHHALLIVTLAGILVAPLSAQWFTLRTPNVPRLASGAPDLKAPAPK